MDRPILYDDATHSVNVIALPGLTFPQRERHAVPVAVGDDLYFVGVEEDDRGVRNHNGGGYLDGVPNGHRIFVRGLIRKLEGSHQYPDWYWHSFPPPPYLGHAGNTAKRHSDEMAAYAVVSGSCIWASMCGHRTYSLCTEKGEWRKVSDSALPFCGRAVYAPEHGLWFGFPDDGRYLYRGLLGA
jgi:hypothetical protein